MLIELRVTIDTEWDEVSEENGKVLDTLLSKLEDVVQKDDYILDDSEWEEQ